MKNEPKIRIKGFEGEWKESLFGSIMDCFSGGTPSANEQTYYGGKIPFIRSGEINEDTTSLFLSEKGLLSSSAKMIRKGTLLYALYGATSGEVSISRIQGAINQAILAIYPYKGYDSYFFKCWLEKNKSYIVSTYLQGGQGNLSGNIVKSFTLNLPIDFKEQRAIANYFRHLDTLIETVDKKLASLKQVKEASLQTMFPQEGESVPKVRFKGFEGEWKVSTLSDLATFSKGHGYSKNDLTYEKGATPIILYGRMYTKYESIIDKVDTYATLHPNSVLSEGNEVIVPGSGETAEDISVASAICSKGIIIGGDLNIIKPNDKIFHPFLALNITYSHAHYDLSKKAQGKTIVHLHNYDFKDILIYFPCIAEQRAIASFFVHLDKQIEIAQQRLELLRRIKSACLDEMFV